MVAPRRTRDRKREWELVTRPYAERCYPGDLVLGEVPVADRSLDGIVIHRPGRGASIPPIHWDDIPHEERSGYKRMLPGARLTVLQAKVERLGFSVLGQALISSLLLSRTLDPPPTQVKGRAVTTATSERLVKLIKKPPYSKYIDADVQPRPVPVARPMREARAKRALIERLPQRLATQQRIENLPITDDEAIEFVLVGGDAVKTAEDLAGRDVTIVHTCKRMYMSLLGHALFTAELVRDHGSASVETLVLVDFDAPNLSEAAKLFAAEAGLVLHIRAGGR